MVAIVEKKRETGGSGVIGIYLKEGRVFFRNVFYAWDNDATSYFTQMSFGVEEYRKAVEELREKGVCKIKGRNESDVLTIELPEKGAKRALGKMSFTHKILIDTFITSFIDWTAEQISLP